MLRVFVLALAALFLAAPEISSAEGAFELLSRTLIEGPAYTAALSGDTVLVGTGTGVAIFRGSSLENPSYFPLEAEPFGIAINRSCAYVAASKGGLYSIVFSGPAPPTLTCRERGIDATTCAVAGGSLFAAGAHEKLYIFDIADRSIPRLKETRKLSRPVRSISADGDFLAITYQRGAEIYRAAPGGEIRKLSEATFKHDAKKGILAGGVLFVLTAQGEASCWNVDRSGSLAAHDPLKIKGIIDVAADHGGGMILTDSEMLLPFTIERASGTAAGGAAVKLKTGKGFTLESVNRYAQPIATGSPVAPKRQKGTSVFVSGERLAVITPYEGIRLYAIKRGGVRPLGFFATRGFATNLIADKGLLYVANGYDGVRIGEVGRDGTVSWIGHLPTQEARDVALAGTNLVIADGGGGIKVADVSDPRKPAIIGRHSSSFFMSALEVAGGRAYCAGGLGGVEIVDITKLTRPRLAWRQDFSEVRGISVDGAHLYIPDGKEGFRVFSLAGGKPVLLSTLDTPGWNCDCYVTGTTAFLADGSAGIRIVDLDDRKNPRTISSLSLNAMTREVFARGETLFAAAHTKGIAAIDISNLEKPAIAAWYDTADDGRGVFADDDFLYAASGSGGVYIFRYHR